MRHQAFCLMFVFYAALQLQNLAPPPSIRTWLSSWRMTRGGGT